MLSSLVSGVPEVYAVSVDGSSTKILANNLSSPILNVSAFTSSNDDKQNKIKTAIFTSAVINASTTATFPNGQITFKKSVEEFVRDFFEDTPILAEVARCESEFRQFTTTGSIIRGIVNPRDVGVMQINERYHAKTAKSMGYDIYTLKGNLQYAQYLYDQQGVAPWSASAPCWDHSQTKKEQKAPSFTASIDKTSSVSNS